MVLISALRRFALCDRYSQSVEALIAHEPMPVLGSFQRR